MRTSSLLKNLGRDSRSFLNGLKDYYSPAVRTATNLVKKVKLARFIGAQIITED